jgi:hypothetical protein
MIGSGFRERLDQTRPRTSPLAGRYTLFVKRRKEKKQEGLYL